MRNMILCILAAGLCLFHFCPTEVFASEAEGLPQIVRWENGNGFDEKGETIKGTWAYDTINPAGKYVFFGESGEVVKKCEQMDESNVLDEGYTPTEQNPGRFAFRCERFDAFLGTVRVVMEEKSGKQISCELDQSSLYDGNLPAVDGTYHIASVDAVWDGNHYETVFPDQAFEMTEGKLTLIRLQVTEQVLESEPEPKETEEIEETVEEMETEDMRETDRKGGKESDMKGKMKKLIAVLSAALAAGILGFVIRKKKSNKYV